MSQKHVSEVITEFIDSKTPEVLAVSGPWGVGKTFAIKSIISKYKGKKSLPKYAYVSVFGAQSLATIKSTLVTSRRSLPFKDELTDTKREKFSSRLGVRDWINQLREVNQFGVKHVVVGAEILISTMARDMLVVIDDIERLGKAISLQDLMGLISELKEQNNCKIILILNSEKLDDRKEVFDQYREKVIDQKLDFLLSPNEATALGLSAETPLRDTLFDSIVKLEISNIRVIKKIERAMKMLFPVVEHRSIALHGQLAIGVCVFAASLYERGRGFGSPDEILKYNRFSKVAKIAAGNAPQTPEPTWIALLDRCGFTNADDFDRCIYLAMERGYIADSELETAAEKLDAMSQRHRLDEVLTVAWNLFHDRLDTTLDQLTEALLDAVRKSATVISTANMNATARILRQLNRNIEADSAVEEWVTQNRANPAAFDLKHAEMFGEIDDPLLRERCLTEFKHVQRILPLQEAIDILLENKRWDDAIPATLATATCDELIALIKANQGPNLQAAVTAIERVRGEDGEHVTINNTLREALTAIGQESPVNRLRVKRWGIDLDAPPPQQQAG